MTDSRIPTWRLREELRRKAEEVIEGRTAFENHAGRMSTKPLQRIELDPREVLQLLDDSDNIVGQRVAQLWHECNGWIPGGERERLQELIDIPLDPPNTGKCNRAGNIPIG